MDIKHSADAILALALAGAALLPGTAAGAQPGTTPEDQAPKVIAPEADPRLEAATGRAKLHWPTPRQFDHLHMTLTLDFPDMNEAKLTGVEELTVRAVGSDRDTLELDCKGPTVHEVMAGGVPAIFELIADVLTIHLPAPAKVGEGCTITIRYEAEFSKNKGDGLTWLKPKDEDSSPTQTSPQVYSQGEAESNSTWFPCHDFPNERLTTELLVTVEDGYEVLSNGALVSKEAAGEGRTRFHWKQERPHANYLVALYIAKCAIVELGGPTSARPNLSIPVYCPIGSEDRMKEAMANVPAMIAFYERYFGQPYPWEKYAQACIRTFNGGMENTSATFLAMETPRRPMHDDLLSHELAHQWTGDLVTCNSWEHIWLNEGWASYMEALWDEEAAKAREAYEKVILSDVRKQRRANRASAPGASAMVSNRYSNPDAVFSKTDDPYAKGAVVLHMLRERLGHKTFDRGVRLYMDRFKFSTAETSDFRRALEEVSGDSLEQFFDQWCLRPGIPRLSIDHAFDAATKAFSITVKQIQKIDGHNPAYVLDVPVRVPLEGGGERWITVHCDRTASTASVVLSGAPLDVEVDPNLTILASVTVHKPTAMWMRQATEGGTYFAKGEATEHLGAASVAHLARLAAESMGTFAQAIVSEHSRTTTLGEGR